MIAYIYDGSFEGLLTSIYHAFYSLEKPEDIVSKENLVENFLIEKIYIETDEDKSARVYEAIEMKISKDSLKRVFYAYLSELAGAEMIVLKYLQLGFKVGREIDLNLANDHVLNMDNIYKKVGKERHRLTGLLRFKRVKGDILYAQVEPDHNVIALVAPHFKERLAAENFIIHDTKREIAIFYNKSEWVIKNIEAPEPFIVKDMEESYEDLWRVYFNAISIKRKTNIKLQKAHMPMRYWKHLTEKN